MLLKIYRNLLKKHSYQGWWPTNNKYHPKDYNHPHTNKEIFEIAIGAILTQNTAWKNAEKSLQAIKSQNLLSPQKILNISQKELALIIKSSGYYNQKAKKLKEFSKFFPAFKNILSRESLLNIWGIGKETADSILLYAYKQPYFVIDSYTKRLFSKLLNLSFNTYDDWQYFFHKNLPKDYKLFNEFHALIVAEGKSIIY